MLQSSFSSQSANTYLCRAHRATGKSTRVGLVVERPPAKRYAQDVQSHEGPKEHAKVSSEGHKDDAGLKVGQGVRHEAHKRKDCTASSQKYAALPAPQATQMPCILIRSLGKHSRVEQYSSGAGASADGHGLARRRSPAICTKMSAGTSLSTMSKPLNHQRLSNDQRKPLGWGPKLCPTLVSHGPNLCAEHGIADSMTWR